MFWGLIMEPNKRYTQTVEKAFHLSMASLDASTASNGDLVQVMICYDNRNYLLCTMKKDSILQVPLDLNFQEGTKIAFTCNGRGHVHLTGYLIPEDEGLDELDDFEEDEEEEDDEEIPKLVDAKKRKALNSLKENGLKKIKKLKAENEDEDDDESDSDNEDGGLGLEDDSDDDLEGEEDDSDDDDEEEEPESPVKTSKKQKQKQNQQNKQNHQQNQNQNQNQQTNKKEKNKIVHGKDVKSEKEQGKQKKNKDDSKSEESSEPQQKRRTVEGGVQVEDIKVGNGAPAKAGKFVSVYYIGRLKNGKKFDATQQGEGFKFRLGKGEVIKGWDVGIIGMKVGGKRRISIPPNMGYGAKGSPPVIPPNSVLNFEVELKAIH